MDKQILLGVVIPVYNGEKYLAEAVYSVLKQPCKDLIVVIINDGSQDRSLEIAQGIAAEDSRVAVLNQENQGVSAARNAGIEYCLSKNVKYVGFLDADDLWRDGIITENRLCTADADVIGFSSYYANNDMTGYRPMCIHPNKIENRNLGTMEWFARGTFASYIYSANMIRNYNVQFPIGVKGNEDVIFLQKTGFCSEKVMYCLDALYIYRMNPTSYTHVEKYNMENAVHVPTAWYHAGDWACSVNKFTEEMCKTWEDNCMMTAGARMLESARGLAENGATYKEMMFFLKKEPNSHMFKCICMEQLAFWQQKDLRLFNENSKKFYVKYRMRGMLHRTLKRMLVSKLLRSIREKKDFPLRTIEEQ